MASAGRKRLPDNVHLLRGTFKPSRHGKRGKKPLVEADLPPMPECLDAEGRAEWGRIMGIMGPLRVLTPADRALLTQYCQLWSEFCRAPEQFTVNRHGQFRQIQGELGLTPAARAKITPADDSADDSFDAE